MMGRDTCAYMHTCIHIYRHTHIHTIRTYIYIHTHVEKRDHGCPLMYVGNKKRQKRDTTISNRLPSIGEAIIIIYIYMYISSMVMVYIYIYIHTYI